MRFRLLALLLALFVWSPVLASSQETVDTRSFSLAPKAPITASYSTSDTIDLLDGLYTFRLVANGMLGSFSGIASRLYEYDLAGNWLGEVWAVDEGAPGPVSLDKVVSFQITNSINKIFVWDVTAFVNGNLSGTATISKQTVPVPGPEAGAGIGALALAGMAYLVNRRRRPIAA